MVHSNVTNHHACGCALRIDIHKAGLDAGFGYDVLHLTGDAVVAVVVSGVGFAFMQRA